MYGVIEMKTFEEVKRAIGDMELLNVGNLLKI